MKPVWKFDRVAEPKLDSGTLATTNKIAHCSTKEFGQRLLAGTAGDRD